MDALEGSGATVYAEASEGLRRYLPFREDFKNTGAWERYFFCTRVPATMSCNPCLRSVNPTIM